MRHVVLLGDSIFDNAKYVPNGISVIQHLQVALPEWQTTLLAVDGDVTENVISQTKLLPDSVTHIVVSVGGNDALQQLNVLKQSVHTVSDALLLFAKIRTTFKNNYRAMLSHLQTYDLPITVCTIYTEFPVFGEIEKVALAMYNEIILSEASLSELPIINLRHICNKAEDYSEMLSIEPSSIGGEKIANAIVLLLKTHDFSRDRCHIGSNKAYTANSEGLNLNPKFLFENFVIGSSNQSTYTLAAQFFDTPSTTYNPLFIYSQPGLGKTHLLNAIGNQFKQKNIQAKVRYIHASDYVLEVIHAYETKNFNKFRQRYYFLDLLLIDDIQCLANKNRSQEEFKYALNSLISANKKVVISSNCLPNELDKFDAQLLSRMCGGLTTFIELPDLEMRMSILLQKAALSEITIDENTLRHIADLVPNDIRALEGVFNKAHALAKLSQC